MWMDEEEPQWGADDSETQPQGGDNKAGEAAAEGQPAPAEGEAAAPAEGETQSSEEKKRDPDRPIYFKHWVRPKFLQYSYIYDYRRNYYDDEIDYLDKRSHGVLRDIPRPQTWAERALRTYTQKLGKSNAAIKTHTDDELIHNLHHSRAIHHYHIKNYYSRKFTTAY